MKAQEDTPNGGQRLVSSLKQTSKSHASLQKNLGTFRLDDHYTKPMTWEKLAKEVMCEAIVHHVLIQDREICHETND